MNTAMQSSQCKKLEQTIDMFYECSSMIDEISHFRFVDDLDTFLLDVNHISDNLGSAINDLSAILGYAYIHTKRNDILL
jgi:hypothetical protein